MSILDLEFDGENFLVPRLTLWQYLDKQHLDTKNKLSVDEWVDFVYEREDAFAEVCTLIGEEMFAEFMIDREVK
jgi:hypothetical protein